MIFLAHESLQKLFFWDCTCVHKKAIHSGSWFLHPQFSSFFEKKSFPNLPQRQKHFSVFKLIWSDESIWWRLIHFCMIYSWIATISRYQHIQKITLSEWIHLFSSSKDYVALWLLKFIQFFCLSISVRKKGLKDGNIIFSRWNWLLGLAQHLFNRIPISYKLFHFVIFC